MCSFKITDLCIVIEMIGYFHLFHNINEDLNHLSTTTHPLKDIICYETFNAVYFFPSVSNVKYNHILTQYNHMYNTLLRNMNCSRFCFLVVVFVLFLYWNCSTDGFIMQTTHQCYRYFLFLISIILQSSFF